MKPEVLLECARKAYQNPKHPWFISGGWAIREDERLRQTYIYFDIKEGADQMALQIALEKEGWVFRYLDLMNDFVGETLLDKKFVTAKTKPDLLIAIVREGRLG